MQIQQLVQNVTYSEIYKIYTEKMQKQLRSSLEAAQKQLKSCSKGT